MDDEDEEEDEIVEIKPKSNLNGPILARDEDDLERQLQNRNIKEAIHNIIANELDGHVCKEKDEIPVAFRKEHGLPEKMGIYEIDFNKLRN